MKKSSLSNQLSLTKISVKRQVKSILVRVPYFDAMIRERDRALILAQNYDRIMNSVFEPKLHSDLKQLEINEIEINKNCNLDCVMCNTSLSERPQRNMELELFENVVMTTKSLGQRRVALHTIGEPLMNPLLEDYFKILRKQGMKVFLSSNGLLLHKRLELLFNYSDIIDELRLSIDGATKETYEKIRKPGKFDRLIENLEHLHRENGEKKRLGKVTIASIVSSDVKSELAYHLSFYSRYVGIRNIDMNLVSGLSPDNSYFLENSILKKHIQPWHPCDQLFSSIMHVLNDGRTTACCRDYNGDLVYGNIRQNTPSELINNEKVLELRKQHLEDRIPKGSLCSNCYRVDPRVSRLFKLFVSELVGRFVNQWEVPKMQARFDGFFAAFQQGFPSKKGFLGLIQD
jgi:MoaA/NifB/PqqE/SkfB family radical SAM enzyme